MKRRNVSGRLIQELSELQITRNKIEEFLNNFITNSSRYVIFMHEILEKKPSKEQIVVPISQYIVSLVTCWETYFRDLFVFLSVNDKQFCDDVIRLNNISINENELNRNGLITGEYISKFFNFQNFKDTETAFSSLYENESFFKAIGGYKRPFVLMRKRTISKISLNSLNQSWYEILKDFFEIRHKIVHDANFRIKLTNSFISQAESICILLPQIVGQYVLERYNFTRTIIDIKNGVIRNTSESDNEEIGYIFTVQDMLAKDWIVVDS